MGIELIIASLLGSAIAGSLGLGALNFASNNIEDPAGLRQILRDNGLAWLADHIPG